MKNTGFCINGKPLPLMSIGCMRFDSEEQAAKVIDCSLNGGATYLDTSPNYLNTNCESWVGKAIKGKSDKFILSAKCCAGNGGFVVGEPEPKKGFSINTEKLVGKVIEQSLKRLEVDKFDCYQLWAVHSEAVFNEAVKKGGWYDGVLKAQKRGLFSEIGITGHGNNKEYKRYLDTGYFSIVTLPFHLFDITRLDTILYAQSKNMKTIAMNPLSGGILASLPDSLVGDFLHKYGYKSTEEFAVRFINAFSTSALLGMSNVEQARFNIKLFDYPLLTQEQALKQRTEFMQLFSGGNFKCTGCGYCMPCPQRINIPKILTLRNMAFVCKSEEAKQKLKYEKGWFEDMDYSRCTKCKLCETRCPNAVKATELFGEIDVNLT